MHYIDLRYVFDTYVFDHGNLAIVYKGLILYCTYRWKYLHKYTDSLVNINFQKSIISIHKLCTCRQPVSLWRFCRTGFVSWEKDTDIKLIGTFPFVDNQQLIFCYRKLKDVCTCFTVLTQTLWYLSIILLERD